MARLLSSYKKQLDGYFNTRSQKPKHSLLSTSMSGVVKPKRRSDVVHITKEMVTLKTSVGYFTLTSDLLGSKGVSQKK
jgi:hypothetical protein